MARSIWTACVVVCAISAVACSASTGEHLGESSARIDDYPECGAVQTTIDGIEAGSNAKNGNYLNCDEDGTHANSNDSVGSRWQCVELAQRYFAQHFNIDLRGATQVNSAAQFCDKTYGGRLSLHKADSDYVPVHGDLVVMTTGTDGHVAVIDTVTDGKIGIVEQNASAGGRATKDRTDKGIGCFIHAAPPPPPDPENPCATQTNSYDAWYCGGNDGVMGDRSSRFHCVGHKTVASEFCSSGCNANPGLADDVCAVSTSGESCDCNGTYVDGSQSSSHTCGRVICGSGGDLLICRPWGYSDAGMKCL